MFANLLLPLAKTTAAAALAVCLLLSGAAVAQTATPSTPAIQAPSPVEWPDAKVVEVAGDQSSIKVQRGSETATLAVKTTDLKQAIKGFAAGKPIYVKFSKGATEQVLESVTPPFSFTRWLSDLGTWAIQNAYTAAGKLLISVLIVVAAYFIGRLLSARLRMPDTGWRIGIVAFALIASAVVIVMGWDPSNKEHGIPWPTRLGPDLSGGAIMVFEVKPPPANEPEHKVDMNLLCKRIRIRLDPGNTKQIMVRPSGATQRQVEIIIPRVERSEVEDIKQRILNLGTLEFLIVCNLRDHETNEFRHVSEAEKLPDEVNELRDSNNLVVARWVPVSKDRPELEQQYAPRAPGQLVNEFGYPTRLVTLADGSKQIQALLKVHSELIVDGDNLVRVSQGFDYDTGKPSVNFSLDTTGARNFAELTRKYAPRGNQPKRHLAIILSGFLESAPTINSVISDHGQITGYNNAKERDAIIAVLQAGQLPAELNPLPIMEHNISATLGKDTIIRGSYALIGSLLVVLLFLLAYYQGWLGGSACLALILNLVLTVACMVSIRAALTFPGMAGLVLSLGMAIDANVLIYERIREELAKGAALRMALRNGYDRAMSAIVDGNITAILTAVILYAIGTDQIRGFAVTLILGLCLSMFTAVFCSRILFEICERKRIMRGVKMLQMLPKTNINFLNKATLSMSISAVVIVAGMVAMALRGQGILDIIFTGGTKAQTVLQEGKAVSDAEARRKVSEWNDQVEKADAAALAELLGPKTLEEMANVPGFPKGDLRQLPDEELTRARVLASLGDVTITSIPPPVTGEQRPPSFYLNTSNPEVAAVRTILDRIFTGELTTNTFEYTGQVVATSAVSAERPAVDENTAPTEDPTAPAPPAEAWVGELRFKYPETRDAIRDRLTRALPPGIVPVLKNPKYVEGRANAFDKWTLTVSAPEETVRAALDQVKSELASVTYFPEVTKFAGAVAAEAQVNALMALLAGFVGIVIYLWIRFQKVAFGVAAVVAIIHDVLVTLALLALSSYLSFIPTIDPFKIDLEIVAALLTIMGYSLNDTIVIFDRIREIRGKSPTITPALVNHAINETLSRTCITSLLVFMTVVVLYFLGGQALHGFAFAMVVGVVAGTYSTMFMACPVLLWILKLQSPTSKQMQTAPQLTGEMAGGPATA